RYEGSGAPGRLAPGDLMEDVETLGDMVGRHHAGADMLGGRCDAGIERVDVEIASRDHVARHDRALKEMDVLAAVDDSSRIIKIDEKRLAVGPGRRLDDMDRRSGGAEMYLVAPGLEIVPGIAAAQREPARGAGDRVFDKAAGNAQAPVIAKRAAPGGHR